MCEANCGAQAAKDGKFVSKKTGIVRSGLCRPGAECVSAGGRADQVQGLAREVVSRRPDVLTAAAWNFVSALKRETTDIPIIMLATWEPQRLGFITSLARPAGNVTGVAWFDLLSKRMELLKEIVPNLRRVAWLSSASDMTNTPPEAEPYIHPSRNFSPDRLPTPSASCRIATASLDDASLLGADVSIRRDETFSCSRHEFRYWNDAIEG